MRWRLLCCLIRYPVLRILGVAAALAAWAAAAFLTGYPSRLTPLGGFLAGKNLYLRSNSPLKCHQRLCI